MFFNKGEYNIWFSPKTSIYKFEEFPCQKQQCHSVHIFIKTSFLIQKENATKLISFNDKKCRERIRNPISA